MKISISLDYPERSITRHVEVELSSGNGLEIFRALDNLLAYYETKSKIPEDQGGPGGCGDMVYLKYETLKSKSDK